MLVIELVKGIYIMDETGTEFLVGSEFVVLWIFESSSQKWMFILTAHYDLIFLLQITNDIGLSQYLSVQIIENIYEFSVEWDEQTSYRQYIRILLSISHKEGYAGS